MGGWRLRLTILLGFALTVGIWIFVGLYFGRRISALEAETTRVSDRYVRSQQLLTAARNQILLSSVYVRDALLDMAPTAANDGLERVNDALGSADSNLAAYVPILDSPTELRRIASLRQEIAGLQETTRAVLQETAGRTPANAGVLLRTRIMPKREFVMGIADELGTLNRVAFVRHQRETAALYSRTQIRIWQILGLALAASLGVAVVATRQAGRLERRERERHERDVELQQDLRRLSARLIRVREQERRSLARELHDEIGQMMTAVKMELSLTQRALDDGAAPSRLLDGARSIVDQALHAVRDLSHLLHPSVLDDLGLVAATEWFIKSFRTRSGLVVEFAPHGLTNRLHPEIETAAYRIIQESLTNVARHAHASRADVTIEATDKVRVTIDDDGIGFGLDDGPRSGQHRGLGLLSMQERAAQLDGTVTITKAPGQGTRVQAVLPVRWRDGDVDETLDRPAADVLAGEEL